MKIGRRVRRSRLLITSGIRLVIVCLVLIVVALFFNMIWLMETAAIVAILVAIFTAFEYWSVKRLKLRKR
ncbi:hypothetical protein [Entomomonas asaccharolytica]|uniref:Uncharacterized protein n=1 Tax=Entomomonas asaccharolytica TaxID=2785331 RepID=A0A974NGD9_9GAMM|nr:hypothetical protein [Entomomonas asaccharolytica]QQP86099.1 hypothetical protein JHT90_02270 [Entomomonas asaccharolytica]